MSSQERKEDIEGRLQVFARTWVFLRYESRSRAAAVARLLLAEVRAQSRSPFLLPVDVDGRRVCLLPCDVSAVTLEGIDPPSTGPAAPPPPDAPVPPYAPVPTGSGGEALS